MKFKKIMNPINYKKIIPFVLFIFVFGIATLNAASNKKVQIGFLNTRQQIKNNLEVKSALKFLRSNKNFDVKVISFDELKKQPSVLQGIDAVWYHRPDSSAFSSIETNKNIIKYIDDFVRNGGGLFLTLNAFKYINTLGFETEVPQVSHIEAKDEGYGRKLGLHALRSHPIFTGLNGGSYIWDSYKDNIFRQVGFFGKSIPKEGKVVAVNWAYITLKDAEKLAVEYSYGKGRVIAVGAYTYYKPQNYNRLNLEKFTDNCILYTAHKLKSDVKARYWSYEPLKVLPFNDSSFSITYPQSKTWQTDNSPIKISSHFASDHTWDLAEQRLVLMGTEKGGIDEIWIHPFMALRDYQVGVMFSYKDTVYWFKDQRPEIEVTPEAFTRTYRFARAFIKEVITADVNKPVAVIHYEYRGLYPAKLVIKYKSNLRFMWPYNSDALGSINYSWNDGLNAFHVKNESNEFNCLIGANKKPVDKVFGQYNDFSKNGKKFEGISTDKFQAAGLVEYNINMNDNLDVVIAGTDEGNTAAVKNYEYAIKNPEKILENTSDYYKKFLNSKLMITTPDKNFNKGYRWALVGTDKFFVHTPELGSSLVAGYATSRRGWGGAQKVSGRPGYAWYFGRDGQWSGMALSDYGDFSKVKSELEVYQKYQALNGKIYHELTTSGAVHYDAADATPLYIILAGHYLRWSGDINFIRSSWKHIQKAIDYCYSTDWNHNHLIENTNVGHGWIEGGALFGAQTTLYLAGCWAKALEESAYMAKNLGYTGEANKYEKESGIVRNIINSKFWNSKEKFFNYGLLSSGKFNPEKTVLPVVPIYFNVVDKDKAIQVLNAYSGNNFSSDWGVRIIGEDNHFFQPTGYHLGSIWPLFTGWTSLAEYGSEQYIQGFTHVMDNLNVYKNWARGYVEEVLNGETYQPSGVCDHQCWSETMVIQPLLEGMLGLNAHAMENEISLSPRLPANWNFINVQNIKAGSHSLNFKMNRNDGETTFNFTHTGNTELKVNFTPQFPQGTKVSKILVDEKKLKIHEVLNKQSLVVNLELVVKNNSTVKIYHSGGISALPVINNPIPNDSSEGFRLLSASLSGKEYSVKVEGKQGKREVLKVYSPDAQIKTVENGKVLGYKNNIYSIEVIFPESTNNYINKSIRITLK